MDEDTLSLSLSLFLFLSLSLSHTPLNIQQFLPLFLGAQSLDVFLPVLLHLKALLRLF
jgi:hypothetical protein